MFAKVFNTARRILSRSPSAQGPSSESKEPTPTGNDPASTMVTSTRRGPVVERTPRSSVRKSKRPLEAEDTPTASKKRRKSLGPEEVAVDTIVLQSTPKEQMPELNLGGKEDKLPIRRRNSPKVVVPKTSSLLPNESMKDGSVTFQEEVAPTVEEPAQQRAVLSPNSPRDATDRALGPAKKRKEKRKEKPPGDTVDSKRDEENQQSAKDSQPASGATPKKTHVRFDSEEPEKPKDHSTTTTPSVAYADSIATLALASSAGEVEDSDSDEAPEEVTAASALTKTKVAEAEAARAFRAQQEKHELRRKERTERVAEEQKQKRRKEEEKAKKLAKLEAHEQPGGKADILAVDIHNLPALLPDSILEAAGDRRPPTPPHSLPSIGPAEQKKANLNRHIKFLERGEKPVKDMKKGPVNVRVLEQQNVHLAAKVNKDTRNVREKWLKGRHTDRKQKNGRGRIERKRVERRAFGGGFLRGEN